MLVLNSSNFSIIRISKLFNFQISMYFDFFNLTILRRLSKNSILFKNIDNSKTIIFVDSFNIWKICYHCITNAKFGKHFTASSSMRLHHKAKETVTCFSRVSKDLHQGLNRSNVLPNQLITKSRLPLHPFTKLTISIILYD